MASGGGNTHENAYRVMLRLNKQSMAFYSEVLPMFYDYAKTAGLELTKEYTLLDVGTRSGGGANFLGQIFSDEKWGYLLKLKVDAMDIDTMWNDYLKLQPYIHRTFNTDIFDLKEDSYDICFCSHTLEHVDDPVGFVRQLRKIAKRFVFITCPFEEHDPIPSHHTVTREIIDQCEPKFFTTYKSVNRWKEDLECVVFAV